MNIRQFLAVVPLAIAMGFTPSRAAQAAKGAAAPAAAAHPAAPGRGAENHSGGHERHSERHSGRTVYVPNYGYTNWYGDYSSPYWSTPGPWYVDNGNSNADQSPSNGPGPATMPSRRPEEEAALADITSARARLATQFESGDAIRSALHDVQEAQRAYDAADAKVRRDLQQDPAYKQAEAEKEQAARKVEAARAADRQPVVGAATTQPAPISAAIVHAAERKLDAASQVTAIVSEREQQDPVVKEAREKLEAATERLNGMKETFDTALQADPQYKTAMQKLAAARAAASH